jgi:hypothetical protein
VARHPHFQHYASPFPGEQSLGAVLDWPGVEALLLLDSFEPDDRPDLWRKVDAHTVVRVDSPSSATGGRAHQGSQCLALS